jgi:hypothetical protein
MVFTRWPLTALVVLGVASTPAAAQESRQVLLARVGVYVDTWERELGSVVADEDYHQEVKRQPRLGAVDRARRPAVETRRLTSEFTLVHFDEGTAEWLGFRRVTRVNDTPVDGDGSRLNQLMNDVSLSWRERWRRVRDLSAVFNLGAISRDFNVPTFALTALRTARHSRFRFSTPRPDRVEGTTLTLVEFTERTRPTLVAGSGGRDVPLRGRVWVDAADGRVRRTELTLRDRLYIPTSEPGEGPQQDDLLTSRLTVVFGPDAQVGTWVPVEMREQYDSSNGEQTLGRATYSNYRRFRTGGRIVGPGR